MNELMKRLLLARFRRVPVEHVPVWDWHSIEGRAFIDSVDAAVRAGMDINEIGSLIGIRNFSQRYRMLRRGKGAASAVDGYGHEDQDTGQGGPTGPVPPLWGTTEGEGRAWGD